MSKLKKTDKLLIAITELPHICNHNLVNKKYKGACSGLFFKASQLSVKVLPESIF